MSVEDARWAYWYASQRLTQANRAFDAAHKERDAAEREERRTWDALEKLLDEADSREYTETRKEGDG